MTIDRGDRTIVSDGITAAGGQETARTDNRRISRLGAFDLIRSLVVVAFAIFAILVLLPAVVAAQASIAI